MEEDRIVDSTDMMLASRMLSQFTNFPISTCRYILAVDQDFPLTYNAMTERFYKILDGVFGDAYNR